MSDGPQRELNLDEWVGMLPSFHLASRELLALRDENTKLRERVERLEKAADFACVLVGDVRTIERNEPYERHIPAHHAAGIVRDLRTALAALTDED